MSTSRKVLPFPRGPVQGSTTLSTTAKELDLPFIPHDEHSIYLSDTLLLYYSTRKKSFSLVRLHPDNPRAPRSSVWRGRREHLSDALQKEGVQTSDSTQGAGFPRSSTQEKKTSQEKAPQSLDNVIHLSFGRASS